jgi:hypothetical protein
MLSWKQFIVDSKLWQLMNVNLKISVASGLMVNE